MKHSGTANRVFDTSASKKQRAASPFNQLGIIKCSNCKIHEVCPMKDPKNRGCSLRLKMAVQRLKNMDSKKMEVYMLEELNDWIFGELEIKKIEMMAKGKFEFDKDTRDTLKLLKDSLAETHKAKHGSKVQVNKQLSYDEIRSKMVEVEAEIVDEVKEDKSET